MSSLDSSELSAQTVLHVKLVPEGAIGAVVRRRLKYWVPSVVRSGLRNVLGRFGDPLALFMPTLEQSLAARAPFDLVVHVGAHLCQEAPYYEELGATTVVWVEADPEIFARAMKEVRDSASTRHILVQGLISAEDGALLALHRYSNDGCSNSVYTPAPHMHERWPDLSLSGESVPMTTMTLGSALSAAGVHPSSFRKSLLVLDVQGHEAAVISGISDSLFDLFDAIVLEVTLGEEIYLGGSVFSELQTALNAHRFVVASKLPEHHGDVAFGREDER